MISDTLRLESAPLGVKVVAVVTGAICINDLSEGVNFKLPSSFSVSKHREGDCYSGKG